MAFCCLLLGKKTKKNKKGLLFWRTTSKDGKSTVTPVSAASTPLASPSSTSSGTTAGGGGGGGGSGGGGGNSLAASIQPSSSNSSGSSSSSQSVSSSAGNQSPSQTRGSNVSKGAGGAQRQQPALGSAPVPPTPMSSPALTPQSTSSPRGAHSHAAVPPLPSSSSGTSNSTYTNTSASASAGSSASVTPHIVANVHTPSATASAPTAAGDSTSTPGSNQLLLNWFDFFVSPCGLSEDDARAYVVLFRSNEIEVDQVLELTETILKDIGVKVGHALRIMKQVPAVFLLLPLLPCSRDVIRCISYRRKPEQHNQNPLF